MATDNWDAHSRWVLVARKFLSKGFRADNIQSGNTKETLGVKDASSLKDLCGDGNSRIDRVGDDQNKCLGAVLSDTLDQVAHNTGVDFEEIITSHPRLAYEQRLCQSDASRNRGGDTLTGDSSRDDNNVSASQGVLQSIILGQESGDFLPKMSERVSNCLA